MIYETRTYRLQPRSLPEVLKRFEAGYQIRKKHSELAAFFYTEIGPLNQIIHIWPYEDMAERATVRAAASKDEAKSDAGAKTPTPQGAPDSGANRSAAPDAATPTARLTPQPVAPANAPTDT